MKNYALFAVVLIMFSCKKEDNHVKSVEMVNIPLAAIPKTSTSFSAVDISAIANAENGCYRDLFFRLKKEKEFQYSLKAYATFESFGACADFLPSADTIIKFIPEKKGTYTFTVYAKPNLLREFTLIVN